MTTENSFIACVVLLLATMLGALIWSETRPTPKCLRSHKENVTVPAWTQFIPVFAGKTTVLVPIIHPESVEERTVCDELEQH